MKKALIDDKLIEASGDGPETATCPTCEWKVYKRFRGRTYYWRHVKGAPIDCRNRGPSHPQLIWSE